MIQFTHARRLGAQTTDGEQVRLLTGFNDIFVSIAVGLLLFAVSSLAGQVSPVLSPVAIAVASWPLAEYFTRKRRMALPSVVLLLTFVGAVYAAAALAFGGAVPGGPGYGSLAAAGLAVLAAWLHWRRFMVPITVAAGAAAASLLVVGTGSALLVSPATGAAPVLALTALCGLAVFAVAMGFDGRDPARNTRLSDVAFWLHLLAAPMVIHPVFVGTGLTGGSGSAAASLAAVLLFLAITGVALAIDRRALIVSALFYVIYAIQNLVGQGGDVSAGFGLTALILGLFLVLLSAAWRPARTVLVTRLPTAWRSRLPHVAAQS